MPKKSYKSVEVYIILFESLYKFHMICIHRPSNAE